MSKQLIVLILALPMHLCYGATITLKEIVPFSSNRSFPMAPSAGISPPPAVLKWDPEQALHFEAKVNPDFEPSQRATGSGTWMSPIMCPEFSYAEGFQTVLDITDLTVPSREDSFFVTDLKLHCSGQPETQASLSGPGTAFKEASCQSGELIKGFRLKHGPPIHSAKSAFDSKLGDPSEGSGEGHQAKLKIKIHLQKYYSAGEDDSASTDVKSSPVFPILQDYLASFVQAKCTGDRSGSHIESGFEALVGDDRYLWGGEESCPNGFAVCGISTMTVKAWSKSTDFVKSAKFYCCRIGLLNMLRNITK